MCVRACTQTVCACKLCSARTASRVLIRILAESAEGGAHDDQLHRQLPGSLRRQAQREAEVGVDVSLVELIEEDRADSLEAYRAEFCGDFGNGGDGRRLQVMIMDHRGELTDA